MEKFGVFSIQCFPYFFLDVGAFREIVIYAIAILNMESYAYFIFRSKIFIVNGFCICFAKILKFSFFFFLSDSLHVLYNICDEFSIMLIDAIERIILSKKLVIYHI